MGHYKNSCEIFLNVHRKILVKEKMAGSTCGFPVLLPSVSNFEFLFITVEIPMGHKKYSKNNCIFLNIYLGKKATEQSFHSVEVLSVDIT